MTALGAMRHTVPGMASELGWELEAFREAFGEVIGEGSRKAMVKVDFKASMVWVPNFIRYNWPESPNVVKSWVGAIDLIPECGLKVEMLQALKALVKGFDEAFKKGIPLGFLEGKRKAMPNQEQEQELSNLRQLT